MGLSWVEKQEKNRERARLWYKLNPEKARAKNKHYRDLNKGKPSKPRKCRPWGRYRISKKTYEAMFKAQNNRCAICNRLNPYKRALHLDHDHQTGKVRELLCVACNTGIGNLNDDPKRVFSALKYLCKHAITTLELQERLTKQPWIFFGELEKG